MTIRKCWMRLDVLLIVCASHCNSRDRLSRIRDISALQRLRWTPHLGWRDATYSCLILKVLLSQVRPFIEYVSFLLTASRILAIWHFAVGRVLQIRDRIPCYFNGLDNLQIRPRTAATWTAVSVRASDCATRMLCPALEQWVAHLLHVSLKLTN